MSDKPLVLRIGNYTAADIKRRDDAASIARLREDEPGRWHLGASVIGAECMRYVWYTFRWAKREEHTGQMHRLFERGHLEEPRFVQSLESVGLKVATKDGTGKQFTFSAFGGHFGGSCDGIGFDPATSTTFLTEFKTHNEKSFKKLEDKKYVRLSKPRHFDQMCLYGAYFQIPLTLYCAVNKNTDERYYEVVQNDFKVAEDLTRKAEYVISAATPPPRIANNPSYSTCKMCSMRGPCWEREPFLKNCRSCRYVEPRADGSWYCRYHGGVIPRLFVKQGCDYWREADVL